MAETITTDVAVIGAGPGGYAAAFLAADKGMKVALIDIRAKPGGVCLQCGCIPSKALLHAARLVTDAKEAAEWGLKFAPPQIDVNTLRARKNKIVDTLCNYLVDGAKKRDIKYLQSRAVFDSSTSLRLEDGTQVRYKNCILATGSSPTKLPQLQVDSPALLDSTGALDLESIPGSLLVVGGGYIGLEMGTVYAALGSKVTVVELTGGLLPGVDTDLVRPLYQRLKTLFAKIYVNSKVTKLEKDGKGLKASFEGEEIEQKQQTFDRILVSVGRRPNSANLGLEKTKVQLDAKGFVKVDHQRRTTDPAIFAIGDVAGEPMLAHKASHEGKVAVEVIAGEPAQWDVRAIPAVVFTDPEIAWCGLTEIDAKKHGIEIQVSRFPWGASGRATTLGRTDGVTKLIVDPKTDRLLGVGIAGVGAGEMIAEGVVAIEMGATALDLAMSIHPHPTMTESVMEAAESLHGLATHLYRPRKEKAKV